MRHKHIITKKDVGKVFALLHKCRDRYNNYAEKIIAVRGARFQFRAYFADGADGVQFEGELLRRRDDISLVEMSKLEQIVIFGKLL